jgi:hypothetical protein
MTNIGFDHSHNNRLKVEDPAYNDFIEYLFNSNFKLGKIEAGINKEKLAKYEIFIIGLPIESEIDKDEIIELLKYTSQGGSLLVINDQGGDHQNKNNLSELTKHFGITFNPDHLFDNENFSNENSRPIIQNFKKHFITIDLASIVHSSGCTITVSESVISEEVDVDYIASTNKESSWRSIFNGSEWIEESNNEYPVIGVSRYGLGKVVSIGNLALFSSLQKNFGINEADNFKLVSNIISWLLNKAYSDDMKERLPIYMTVPIEQDMFYWLKEQLDQGKWKNIEDLINFALRVLKIRLKEEKKEEEEEE